MPQLERDCAPDLTFHDEEPAMTRGLLQYLYGSSGFRVGRSYDGDQLYSQGEWSPCAIPSCTGSCWGWSRWQTGCLRCIRGGRTGAGRRNRPRGGRRSGWEGGSAENGCSVKKAFDLPMLDGRGQPTRRRPPLAVPRGPAFVGKDGNPH